MNNENFREGLYAILGAFRLVVGLIPTFFWLGIIMGKDNDIFPFIIVFISIIVTLLSIPGAIIGSVENIGKPNEMFRVGWSKRALNIATIIMYILWAVSGAFIIIIKHM